MIKPNEGKVDRIIRVLLGIVLAFVAFYWGAGLWQIVLYILSAVFFFTGLFGYCHLYTILGVDSLKKDK